MFLLTLGGTGMLIGVALALQSRQSGNRRLLLVALIYVLCSAGLLCARQAVAVYMDERRKRRAGSL